MSASKERILTICHGHPDFNLGGGEIAAFNLYRAYGKHPDVEASFFLGRHDRGRGPTGVISLRRENEYLWEQGVGDWFRMKAANTDCLTNNFAELVRRLRPTIVHVHHYVHMGLEFLHIIKRINPSIKIVMTIHEYVAICFNQGQMIKTQSGKLCFRESPEECHRCFPEHSIEDFWLRKHRYHSFFRLVDQFVSPSDFLRKRYVNWGIEADRIATIENGQADREMLPPRELAEGETRNRFAFFGQVTPFKGVDVLLKGLASLKKSERRKIVVEIHGAKLEDQEEGLQKRISELRRPLEKEGCLQWIGAYEPFQLADRMRGTDWVVVPSIWWENSPMVIQEAFTFGRPLVCSDIGGMAEKITDRVNGVHVPVGSSVSWGATLLKLAKQTDEWDKLREGIVKPINYSACAEAHLDLLS